MFFNPQSKSIANAIRSESVHIRQILQESFERSIVGVTSEVQFFRNLLREVRDELNGQRFPGLRFSCRVAEIHAKPKIRVANPRAFVCELGDLLVVVKYRRDGVVVEKKSVLHQVKLCKTDSDTCDIDQNQLELLCDWPTFEFGRNTEGGPVAHNIAPKTLEFGSYLIMLRNPPQGEFLPCHSHYCRVRSYGVQPYALSVRQFGPSTLNLSMLPYAMNAAEALFSHIAFEIGEHHNITPGIEPW